MVLVRTYSAWKWYHSKPQTIIYLDRDGTLNKCPSGEYVKTPFDVSMMPGAAELMRLCLKITPFVYLISNQRLCDHKADSMEDFVEYDLIQLRNTDHTVWSRLGRFPYMSLYAIDDSEDRKPYSTMVDFARNNTKCYCDIKDEVFIGNSDTDRQCAGNAGVDFFRVEDSCFTSIDYLRNNYGL
jgi:histidinol phosphatase-like enzyme